MSITIPAFPCPIVSSPTVPTGLPLMTKKKREPSARTVMVFAWPARMALSSSSQRFPRAVVLAVKGELLAVAQAKIVKVVVVG